MKLASPPPPGTSCSPLPLPTSAAYANAVNTPAATPNTLTPTPPLTYDDIAHSTLQNPRYHTCPLCTHPNTETPPLGTLYHAHNTCPNPALTTARYHANAIIAATLKLLTLANDLRPGGGKSLLHSMRQAMITTDTTPHHTTPENQDTPSTYTRPTTIAIASKHDWHNLTKAQGVPTCSSPFNTHPTLTLTGLIPFPHDISQYMTPTPPP